MFDMTRLYKFISLTVYKLVPIHISPVYVYLVSPISDCYSIFICLVFRLYGVFDNIFFGGLLLELLGDLCYCLFFAYIWFSGCRCNIGYLSMGVWWWGKSFINAQELACCPVGWWCRVRADSNSYRFVI